MPVATRCETPTAPVRCRPLARSSHQSYVRKTRHSMQSNFRYMVMCGKFREDDRNGGLDLLNVISAYEVQAGQQLVAYAVVSYFGGEQCEGKRLSVQLRMMNGSLGLVKSQETQMSPCRGAAEWTSKQIMSFSESGIYAFELLDLDGAFSSPGSILSTFKFDVRVCEAASISGG